MCHQNGGFFTFAKLVLFQLLVLVVRDSVITLSGIAYNVSNNLDGVLPAIACTMYHGNIFLKVSLSLGTRQGPRELRELNEQVKVTFILQTATSAELDQCIINRL